MLKIIPSNFSFDVTAITALCRRKKKRLSDDSDDTNIGLLVQSAVATDLELGVVDKRESENKNLLPHFASMRWSGVSGRRGSASSDHTHSPQRVQPHRRPSRSRSANVTNPIGGVCSPMNPSEGRHSIPSTATSSHQKKKTQKIDMNSLNTYDIFKVFSTMTMFADHYSYFGLPGLTPAQSAWFRIIGRSAAPGFFFLAGFSSKRFRIRTYFAALFVYLFITVIPLGFVHSPWESIMNVLLINCVLYYIPPHRVTNRIVHLLTFVVLQYYRKQWSADFNIGYGTLPFALAIAGDSVKYQHELAPLWIVAAMMSHAQSSINVFAHGHAQTMLIIGECTFNAIIMIMFRVKEIKTLNEFVITRIARDGLKWLSRSGLVVYIGHLCLFRMVQLCYYSGSFRHLIY